jgi:hypothetical protein
VGYRPCGDVTGLTETLMKQGGYMKKDERGKEGSDQQSLQRVKPNNVAPMNPSEIPFYHGKLRPKDPQKITFQHAKQGPKGKK